MGIGERIYAGARLMLVAVFSAHRLLSLSFFFFFRLLMELINWTEGRGMLIDTVDLRASHRVLALRVLKDQDLYWMVPSWRD